MVKNSTLFSNSLCASSTIQFCVSFYDDPFNSNAMLTQTKKQTRSKKLRLKTGKKKLTELRERRTRFHIHSPYVVEYNRIHNLDEFI